VSDLGRDHVAAFELPVPNPVTRVIELRDDPSTAALYREHSVARPVGDEDLRLAPAGRRCHEPRREGDYAREEVAVRNSEREGVGGTVGEARYRQPPGIQCQAVEHPLQRPVDELDVWAVASHEHVPLPLRSSCYLRFPMGVNIGGVQEALGRVWALCRDFTYSKQAPSSAVPTDSVRTDSRSDPYSRNRRRQVRFCRW
jgi:hypothetical protein